jgi:hypothetical protein
MFVIRYAGTIADQDVQYGNMVVVIGQVIGAVSTSLTGTLLWDEDAESLFQRSLMKISGGFQPQFNVMVWSSSRCAALFLRLFAVGSEAP